MTPEGHPEERALAESFRTPEEEARKARGKEIHRRVMIILGALIAASGLAAWHVGRGGASFLQNVMFGRVFRSAAVEPPVRRPKPTLARWREFDAAALADARSSGRLVLLSVVAPWSGPSRLMDERAYADPGVADFLAKQTVAVRVDAEARPDLALRYLGRGWPTTALVLPSGRVLEAGTYMDPGLLLTWAQAVARPYALRREAVAAALEKASGDAEAAPAATTPREGLDQARLALGAPQDNRFPSFARLDALLDEVREPWAIETATRTLRRETRFEDLQWGGYYRDSREHEKILADQAGAVSVLARLSSVGDARRTLSYVERFLEDEKGAYYSSQAGEAELKDGDIESGDSFFKKNDAARLAAGLPRVDRRSFASENAAMARAVLSSGKVARPADRAFALKVLDRWWRLGIKDGRVSRELGGTAPRGLLDDQAAMARAYLAAGQPDRAAALLADCEKRLLDPKTGVFFDREPSGLLPPELDRLLVAPGEYDAWRAYGDFVAALPKSDPRRKKAQVRADALRAWLWAHRDRLDPARLAGTAFACL